MTIRYALLASLVAAGCSQAPAVPQPAAGHTHAVDALLHVATGHYEGEHWLGSFAVYLLTEPK